MLHELPRGSELAGRLELTWQRWRIDRPQFFGDRLDCALLAHRLGAVLAIHEPQRLARFADEADRVAPQRPRGLSDVCRQIRGQIVFAAAVQGSDAGGGPVDGQVAPHVAEGLAAGEFTHRDTPEHDGVGGRRRGVRDVSRAVIPLGAQTVQRCQFVGVDLPAMREPTVGVVVDRDDTGPVLVSKIGV
ncbi:Uncharacterised protein [Mycobacteroides abscessus subsp. abscessus]|nr:Uncharacterised protein [Mycobacteroides abscessus subsp. abscessus]